MKSCLISAVVVLLTAALLGQAAADESEAKAYVSYFKFFIGEWSLSVEGDVPVTGSWKVENSSTGISHATLLKLGDDTSDGVYGYDPATGDWRGVGFSSRGTRWSESLTKTAGERPRSGDVIDYCGKSIANDGAVRLFRMRLKIVSEDSFTVKQMIIPVQGDAEPEMRTITAVRKK
jgi:hypothetical protein